MVVVFRRLYGEEKNARRQEITGARIKVGTALTYQSKINTLQRLDCTIDFAGLEDFILGCEDPVTKRTVDGYIAAVNWYRQGRGWYPMSDVDCKALRLLGRGGDRMRAEVPKPRGAVTQAMLVPLIATMRRRGADDDAIFSVRLCFSIAGRTEEMTQYTKDHFVREDGEWNLVRSKTHDPLHGRRFTRNLIRFEKRFVHPLIYEELEARLANLANNNDPVCPFWNGAAVNAHIKAASIEHVWSPDLHWCGPHTLRHGAAIAARMRYGATAVKDWLGHESEESGTTYMMTNAERVAKYHSDQAKQTRHHEELAIAAAKAGKKRRYG